MHSSQGQIDTLALTGTGATGISKSYFLKVMTILTNTTTYNAPATVLSLYIFTLFSYNPIIISQKRKLEHRN